MKSSYLNNLENFMLAVVLSDYTYYDNVVDKLDNTLKYRVGKYEDILDFFRADVVIPLDVLGAR